MRTKFLGLAAVVAVIAVAACSGQTVKEFGKADQQAIRKLVQDFSAAYNAKDLEKVGSYFSGNAVLMPANRSALRGVDLVKTYYDERFKGGATNLQVEPQDISGHGPLAYMTATFSLDLVPPGGGVPVRDRGKVLWIVRDFNGQWRFECQIMSSDLPPVVAAPAVEAVSDKKQ
jgi:uncharacterized protein (TIGR02246 family)